MSLKQLTDLYVKGVTFPLADGTCIWIQKLTPFEQGECRRLASLARARTMLALREIGSDDYLLVTSQLADLSEEDLRTAVLGTKYAEQHNEVLASILADPDWAERNDIRTGTDVSTLIPGSLEDELLTQMEAEYAEEVIKRLTDLQEAEQRRMDSQPREELLQVYRDLYVAAKGADSFSQAYMAQDLYFMLRQCAAVPGGESYDHSGCDHGKRFLASSEELKSLPDELLADLRAAEATITMSVRDARFSDRQGSSSDSSPLPSAPADSESSSPTDTPQPAGT